MHPFERGTLNLAELDADPFRGMLIDDCTLLDQVAERSPCPQCKKSRKYFCYVCFVPVTELQGRIPRLKLPIKIDIIKHKGEIDGKSTAAHAAVLAPDDVRIFTYPDMPTYGPDEKVVLVYPSPNAKTVSELFTDKGGSSRTTEPPFTRAVLIDSTWNQSNGIFKDERVRSLPTLVLKEKISQFWRHQKNSPRWYLATIEAIHQLLVEVDCFSQKYEPLPLSGTPLLSKYDGKYDNILFFFRFMYAKIHTLYDHDKLLSYKRRLL